VAALSILVVGDEIIIGLLLGEVLVGMGYDVCAIASTEAEAIAAAARRAWEAAVRHADGRVWRQQDRQSAVRYV
jgi:CheY-like chemotaxis protein